MNRALVLLTLLMTGTVVDSLHAAGRVALLIGCAKYSSDLGALSTPVNDALALKEMLERPALGFECLPVVQDATYEQLHEALQSFQTRAAGAEMALVFFSGHGFEHEGENYLIPVDARLLKPVQFETQTLDVRKVIGALGKTNASVKLAILDCCRDSSFRQTRSWAATRNVRDEVLRELGEAELPASTLVCFATSAGRKAADVLDDHSTHSPFAQFLLKELPTPGLSLRDLFERVHDDLEAATDGRQVPAIKTDNALSKVFRQTVLVAGSETSPVKGPRPQLVPATLEKPPPPRAVVVEEPKPADHAFVGNGIRGRVRGLQHLSNGMIVATLEVYSTRKKPQDEVISFALCQTAESQMRSNGYFMRESDRPQKEAAASLMSSSGEDYQCATFSGVRFGNGPFEGTFTSLSDDTPTVVTMRFVPAARQSASHTRGSVTYSLQIDFFVMQGPPAVFGKSARVPVNISDLK